jgi:hypothetical protein
LIALGGFTWLALLRAIEDFNWGAVAWLAWCSYTLVLCIRRYVSTRRSERAANTPTSRQLAAANVASARSRVWRMTVFVALGIRSMIIPPSHLPGDGVISTLVGIAFVSLAIVEQRDVEREVRVQRRLLRARGDDG